MKKTKLSQTPYFKPTPLGWRIAGDLALLFIPIVDTAIVGSTLPDVYKYWLPVLCNCILIGVKYCTNMAQKK